MRDPFVSIGSFIENRILYSLILLTIVFITGMQVYAQSGSCSYLVWADEFTVNGAPETTKWSFETGAGGWGNNEIQTYTDSRTNSRVENDRLIIKAVKSNNQWTSARMVSRAKGDWLYGRIEVKAKLPSGKGTWPAIWMLPTDWAYGNWPKSGEIDIMEHVGYDPGKIHGTAHTEAYNHSVGTQKGASISIGDALTAFHLYAIEWNNDQIKWFVDDQLYFTFNNENKTSKEWPFDKRFHLLLNIAIGGNWGGAQGIDPNLTEATMEIDYVRVYQNQLPKPVIEGKKTLKAGENVSFSTQNHNSMVYDWSFPKDVQIISGQSTSTVNVIWGSNSGDVSVKLTSPCETIHSDPLRVSMINTPTGDKYTIPIFDTGGIIRWTAVPGNSNQITLSGTESLKVAYSISEPTNNPCVIYEFADLIDFSEYREMSLSLKCDPANPPSVIRIDLEDKNGNVDLNDLFKTTSFGNDPEFHKYSYQFGKNPGQIWLLNEIKRIKIYINYGIFGKTGNGTIELKDVVLTKSSVTSTKMIPNGKQNLYPNPFIDKVYISGSYVPDEVKIYNISGQLVDVIRLCGRNLIDIKTCLHPGVYVFQWMDESRQLKQSLRMKQSQ